MKNYRFTKKCVVCGREFKHCQGIAKFCSDECRQEFYIKKYRRRVTGIKLPTGTVGAIAELIIGGDLLKRGYSVFRALSSACYCDLIAVKKDVVLHVEVRTGYRAVNNRICFPRKASELADTFGVYERNSGEIIYTDKNQNTIQLQ